MLDAWKSCVELYCSFFLFFSKYKKQEEVVLNYLHSFADYAGMRFIYNKVLF